MDELAAPLPDLAQTSAAIFGAVPCAAILRADRVLEAADPGEALFAATNRMWWSKLGAMPVLEDGRLVGCFAEEDLLRALARGLPERTDSDPGAEAFSVWGRLLHEMRVGDVMTPVKELPVVSATAPLLEGLAARCAPDVPPGRYLFLRDESAEGETLRLVSFRDVARFLTALYDGAFPEPHFASAAAAADARDAARQLLELAIGDVRREARLGHEPNVVPLASSGADTVRTMWESRRGYVIVTLADGGPIGICTRRDVLRACVPRFANLGRAPLVRMMRMRVRTVTETDTLCGLFKRMALETFRHMPLVDASDRVEAVISMGEGIALVAGRSGRA